MTDPAGKPAAFVLYKASTPGQEGAQGFGRVHPAHHGRGIGAFLVDEVDRRWSEPAAARPALLRHWTSPRDRSASLFGSRGYALVRREFHLERALRGLAAVDLVPGVRIRAARTSDEAALHEVHEDAFSLHWGLLPSTLAEWRWAFEVQLASPGAIWLAEADERPVGELMLEARGDHGWIVVLGVRAAWQGRGVGRALLRTGFHELARLGCSRVLLGVDAGNETGALHLYESEGMTVRREWHVVEKALPAG